MIFFAAVLGDDLRLDLGALHERRADLEALAADEKHLAERDRVADVRRRASRPEACRLAATRYCLPPVLITAYMASALFDCRAPLARRERTKIAAGNPSWENGEREYTGEAFLV